MLKVVVVDDQALMRSGFTLMLSAEDDIEVVGEASDGAEAVEVVGRLRPDVVLMDVQMPGMDGIEATRRIVAEGLSSVLILTTFDRDDYLFAALDAGASGFLLKNAGPEELVSAARVAAAGDALLAPEVTRRVIERHGAADHMLQSESNGIPVSLTDREAEILRLLASAMSNAEIARQLFIGEATVKTHVSNLLQKTGSRDRVAAVVWAYRNGVV